ncbi:ComE operon protein 3 [Paenibacillus sp. CECT 9249]|uniref:ComEC/Rec2 family competence protein n=1 Tax=Paenibacillus sp. CECT 9249 TaxID=2845385 RepID=UPI001E4C0501|nr:ComEC/Rec2 family competence protein [Paenibacillus sp. CECT 9249]CAH0121029.1 ComE operon protein 3 [Paenibacillus sp. CECT 9249]
MADRRPVVWFAISWIAGSGAACLWNGIHLPALCAAALCFIPILVYYRAVSVRLALLCWAAFCAAALYWHWNDMRNASGLADDMRNLDEREVRLAGTIDSPVDVDGDRADFRLRGQWVRFADTNEHISINETLLVQVRLTEKSGQQIAGRWERGDRVELEGMLKRPAGARNFGAFDYGAYLRTQRIHWIAAVKGTDSVVVKPEGRKRWNRGHLLRWNDRLRAKLGDKLDELFAERYAGFMKGLVIGMRDDLDPERFREFAKLGLTHVLAISGLHVAVFIGCFFWIFRKLGLTKETSQLLVMALIPFYVLLSGASPSVVRAGMMAIVALYAARQQVLKDGLHILCIAALLMLWWDPYYLVNVSFQLSFIVTAGLILGVPRMQRWLPLRSKKAAALISLNAVAELVSFPMSIYYFHQYSLLSIAANIVLVSFISLIILPLGMATLSLGIIYTPLGQFAAWTAERLTEPVFRIVSWMNGPDAFLLIWPKPAIWQVMLYYALLVAFAYLAGQLHSRRHAASEAAARSAGGPDEDETVPLAGFAGGGSAAGSLPLRKWIPLCAVFCLWGGLLAHMYQPALWDRNGSVQFLDVGQGDSILIRTPHGKTLLVDGGGTVRFRKPGDEWKERKDPFEVGQKLLVPLLKQRGVHKLDAVIATHQDQDHIGGLQAVLEQIPTRAVIFNGTLKPGDAAAKLFRTANEKRIPLYAAVDGQTLTLDKDTEIKFIYPSATFSQQPRITITKEQNDRSVAFVMKMKESTFLFTGDMERKAELAVVDKYARTDAFRPVDVMKVAHHGSKTSTTDDWLRLWQPKTAVISVGAANFYGHPTAQVLDRLKAFGVSTLRTDKNGEVQMQVRRDGIYVRTKLIEEAM